MNWIETEDEKPNKTGEVLCFFKTSSLTAISVEWYMHKTDKWLPVDDLEQVLNTPIHWMYLPDEPNLV